MADLTPFQTVGPFFHFALPYEGGDALALDATAGRRVEIEGTVRDGAAHAVADALVEIWQANAVGKYRHPADEQRQLLDPSFDGFGRIATDANGRYGFTTILPGRVPGPDGTLQAPHLLVGILARGILTRLITRMYFDDEPSTAGDPVLALAPAARRSTLVAHTLAPHRYRFDLVLQGPGETVFFDL